VVINLDTSCLNRCPSQYYPEPNLNSTSRVTAAANAPFAATPSSVSQPRYSGVVEPQSSLSQALGSNSQAVRSSSSAVPASSGRPLGVSGALSTKSGPQRPSAASKPVQTSDMTQRTLSIAGQRWASEAPVNGILVLPPILGGFLYKRGPMPTDVVHSTNRPPPPSSIPQLIFFDFQQQADGSCKIVRRASQPHNTANSAQPSSSNMSRNNEQKAVHYSGPHVQTKPAAGAVAISRSNPQATVVSSTNPPLTTAVPVTPNRLQQAGVKIRTPSEADKKRLAKDVIRALGLSSRDGKRKRADDEVVSDSEKEGNTKRRSVEPDAVSLQHNDSRPVSALVNDQDPFTVAPNPSLTDTQGSSKASPNIPFSHERSSHMLSAPTRQRPEQTAETTAFSVNETELRGAATDSSDDGVIEDSILPRTHSPSSRLYTPPPITPTLTTPPPASPPAMSPPADDTPRPPKVPLFLPSLSSSPSVPSVYNQHASDDDKEDVDAEVVNRLPDTPQRSPSSAEHSRAVSSNLQSWPPLNRKAYVLVPPLPPWAKRGKSSQKYESKAGKEKEAEEDISDAESDHHEWTEAEGQSTSSDKL
jgi:hypothetical protein